MPLEGWTQAAVPQGQVRACHTGRTTAGSPPRRDTHTPGVQKFWLSGGFVTLSIWHSIKGWTGTQINWEGPRNAGEQSVPLLILLHTTYKGVSVYFRYDRDLPNCLLTNSKNFCFGSETDFQISPENSGNSRGLDLIGHSLVLVNGGFSNEGFVFIYSSG